MFDLNTFFYLSWALQGALFTLFAYKHFLNRARPRARTLTTHEHPCNASVCVQVPIYNEPKHIKGVIEAVSDLDWPTRLLEIQILDDSSDKTTQIATEVINKIKTKKPALNLELIHRGDRKGFKAGALNFGLQRTDSKYCAIFDADFRPERQWLKKTIPIIENSNRACALQTPWSFINENQNPLTRLQGLQLRLHFYVEHRGRYNKGLCFNFNGTGGVWRSDSIRKLGGWSACSVTEDLYLSYLAQLKGEEMIFCDSVTSPSELPADLNSYLIQQRRWALGSGQVTKLLFGNSFFLKSLTSHRGWDMLTHLSGYLYGLFGASLFSTTVFLLAFVDLSTTHYSNTLLNLNRLSWVIVMALYTSLCFSRKIGSYSSYSIKDRFIALFYLMILSPILMIFISYKFLFGLIGSLKKPKNLIFHRTPKKITKLRGNLIDSIISASLLGLLVATLFNCVTNGANTVSLFIFLQILVYTAMIVPGRTLKQ